MGVSRVGVVWRILPANKVMHPGGRGGGTQVLNGYPLPNCHFQTATSKLPLPNGAEAR